MGHDCTIHVVTIAINKIQIIKDSAKFHALTTGMGVKLLYFVADPQ